MNNLFRGRNIDWPMCIIYIGLVIVSIIAVFSASKMDVFAAETSFNPIAKHLLFIAIAIVMIYIIQLLPSFVYRIFGYGALAFSCIFLYVMLIPGNPFVVSINGAGRWCKLFGIVFQPSELAKISLIIVTADLLSRIRSTEDMFKYFLISLGITAFVCFPILLGNLSTTLLLSGVVVLMWILARIPAKYILSTIGIALTCLVLGLCVVKFAYVDRGKKLTGPFSRATVWVERLTNMSERSSTTEFSVKEALSDDNYQSSLAMVAIARGGASPFGVLPGNSLEKDYLPLAHMDYLFSIIVEETGFVGAFILIFLYLAVLFRACYISNRYEDYSAMLMVMGLALMMVTQAFASMAVNVGLVPVTGQPLPLVCKGGTSLLVYSLYFAIMMGVAREQATLAKRQQGVEEESFRDKPEVITLDD